jgi:hypothetical protein
VFTGCRTITRGAAVEKEAASAGAGEAVAMTGALGAIACEGTVWGELSMTVSVPGTILTI